VNDELECMSGPEGCEGPVAYRMALSATGVSYPRCEGHWHQRLETEQRLRQDYPDSPTPPAWFGPTSGGMNEWGEYWDDY
jgi:hypothetical protein